ncbi:CsiV family protein [Marinobacter piscensis]|uniref:CsiV family protein n=1 Tax=Marinobacter piscensis TaxID=1562308 RepID=UPI001FE52BC8|nr:CsiV family protein [Marinobacter piscensis]
MQTDSNRLCQRLAHTLLAVLLAITSVAAHAQQGSDNLYRAEFVILERIIAPDAVNERMASHQVKPPVNTRKTLYSVAGDGSTHSSLKLSGRNQLYLGNAANRLENSGKYRVLMATGWYQSFPQNYQGEPLRVEIGDWLSRAGQREIEGHIKIDRKRYLHVNVHLNHWQEGKVATSAVTASGEPDATPESSAAVGAEQNLEPEVPLELLTWIRETRRMRSEEIHFLDSPTIGVLIFFRKVNR